mmetsp:Transcript_1416/g.3315  ORF Transcript_1416/g.3315 Transcript_1416/m.3315 type:complete len:258 (-) Transcript_1416:410-1183(-)|eukprot:CAMPEP_0179009478 /NCGR_PEP_ID=MMETSP0795-20121207/16294_1 /TAXON_ID=88552 /ORGANISM="Amoebophrya sp., Strain Ameob2" /LENGTH=257 /DNA_ID=CAMNT_0020704679 /DNA_START=303 /DNA_END=1076 /DNA_ORIENTATION=+
MTSCAKALQLWSEKNEGANPEEAEAVALLCLIPPINKMDSSLNALVNCKRLSLSTNAIDKMISLPGLKNLVRLSLGRNQIKKIQGLEEVGATLEELWISYNHIATLDGLHPCVKLHTLFISNNKIKQWEELAKLQQLPDLGNVLLVGNPLYEGMTKKAAAPQVLKILPNLKTLDGEMAGLGGGDSVADAVRDAVGGDFDGAIGGLGMDLGAAMDKAAFANALTSIGVGKDDADALFDEIASGGNATLEAAADYVANN